MFSSNIAQNAYFTPLSAFHIFSGVTGMSMLVIPLDQRASMTAFTTAVGAAIVPASPIPFAPIGLCGDGV